MAIVQHYIVGGVSRSIQDALNLAKAQGRYTVSAGLYDPFNPAVVQLRNGSGVLFAELSAENVTQSQGFSGQLDGLFTGDDVALGGDGDDSLTGGFG